MSKIKIITIYFLTLFLTIFFVSKTISFFVGSTQGESIVLRMSEWKSAESGVIAIKNEATYSVEEKILSQNSSVPKQSFISEESHYLSFQYKIESSESALGFDTPNFLLKINNEVIFQDNAEHDIWKRGFVNLKTHKSFDSNYSLEFISENTFDSLSTPALFLKDISTSRFLAKENDLLRFSVSKEDSEIHLNYLVEENGVLVQKNKILTSPYEFLIKEHFYNNEIEYYSIDSFGNVEDSKYILVDTDFGSPNVIEDIECFPESDSELSATFTSPADNFSNEPSYYEIRLSGEEVLNEVNWNSSEVLEIVNFKKFGFANLPSISGGAENILIQNLNPDKNFLLIRSIDQSGNYSSISSCFKN